MTKKDFELIANVICTAREEIKDYADSFSFSDAETLAMLRGTSRVVSHLSTALKSQYPRFDTEKFYRAAKGWPNVNP